MTVVHRQDLVLLERLGGAEADVHRALVRTTGRVVVAKHTTWERRLVSDRLDRAASILRRIQHPGIVRLVARIDDDHGRCLLLAHEAGGSLGDLVASGGTFPPGDVAAIGARIAGALAALHAGGVVHRDVHPGNVLLDADLAAVLVDLDNALDEASPPLPGDREVVGHRDHLDPRVLAGRRADPSSDLHGLATTLWTTATSRVPPRDGPGGRVALPSQTDVPAVLRDVLSACLDGTITDAATAATALRSATADLRRSPHAGQLGVRQQGAAATVPPPGDTAPAPELGAAADEEQAGHTQRWGVPPPDVVVEPPAAAPALSLAERWSLAPRRPVAVAAAAIAVLLAAGLLAIGTGGTSALVVPPPPCDTTTAPPGQQVTADLDGDGCGVVLGLVDGELSTPDGRFRIGQSGDVLLAGDWDGDGRWGIGLYRPTTGQVFLVDALGPGATSRPATQHAAGGTPVVVQGRNGHEVRVDPP